MLDGMRGPAVVPRHRAALRAAAVSVAASLSLVPAMVSTSVSAADATALASVEAPAGHTNTSITAKTRKPEVVTSVYALAQLASYIGGSEVRVVDIAPPGAQPLGLALTASGRQAIEQASLVIDVGDGYQPQVEAAAASARRHLALLPRVSKQAKPYEFWLDPYLMSKAAVLIAKNLTAADPAGRTEFDNGSRNFQSVATSIEDDLDTAFTSCQHNEFVTSDGAFQRFASRFDLVDVSVDATGVKKTTTLVRQNSISAVFSEAGVPSGQLQEVAKSAGVTVQSLDPMEVAPFPGAPAPLSYFAATEYNLTTLEGPLACETGDDSF
jgi:ABC-type Zn uptake system ZnuABC Zn-binding protein ZnuA